MIEWCLAHPYLATTLALCLLIFVGNAVDSICDCIRNTRHHSTNKKAEVEIARVQNMAEVEKAKNQNAFELAVKEKELAAKCREVENG